MVTGAPEGKAKKHWARGEYNYELSQVGFAKKVMFE